MVFIGSESAYVPVSFVYWGGHCVIFNSYSLDWLTLMVDRWKSKTQIPFTSFCFLRERRGRSKYKVHLSKTEMWALFINFFIILITNSFTIKTGTKRNNLTLVVFATFIWFGRRIWDWFSLAWVISVFSF